MCSSELLFLRLICKCCTTCRPNLVFVFIIEGACFPDKFIMSVSVRILWSIWVFHFKLWHVQGKVNIHVTNNYFDGFHTYIPVLRSRLQTRLYEINNRSDDNGEFLKHVSGSIRMMFSY